MQMPSALRATSRLSLSILGVAALTLLTSTGCLQVAGPRSDSTSLVGDEAGSVDTAPSSEFERRLAQVIEGTVESPDESSARSTPASVSDDATDAAGLDRGIHWINGPTQINHSGVYRVEHDFSVSEAQGDAIVIHANFVWLDLGGHTITGPGNKIGRGIVVEGSRFVFVANGRIDTFGIGVALLDTDRSAVGFVRVQGGDEMAAPPVIPPQIGFLLVNAAHNSIRWNDVRNTNLGFFVRGGGSYQNLIAGNEAVAGDHGLLGICYNPASGEGDAGPMNDVVRRNRLARFGTGIQTSAGSAYNLFAKNRIEYFVSPYTDFNGTNEFVDNTTIQL